MLPSLSCQLAISPFIIADRDVSFVFDRQRNRKDFTDKRPRALTDPRFCRMLILNTCAFDRFGIRGDYSTLSNNLLTSLIS